MRIALVMTHAKVHNQIGGATRLFFEMASEMTIRGFQVDGFYSDASPGIPLFNTHEKCGIKNLAFNPSLNLSVVKLWRKIFRLPCKLKIIKTNIDPLRSFYQKNVGNLLREHLVGLSYDLFLAFNYSDVVSLLHAGIPKEKIVSMCHTDPSRVIPALSNYEKKCWYSVRAVHYLLPEFKESFPSYLESKLFCLPNPVKQQHSQSDLSSKTMVYLARVEKNKRPHLIVEAINKIDKEMLHGWNVLIFGGFPNNRYKMKVESAIKSCGLADVVHLMGVTRDPQNELINASICIFPSAFEGFGLGLAEAMALGLPAIGFEDCSGVNQLIEDGRNGILCHDVSSFSDAIKKLISDESLRARMGMCAKESMKKYANDIVWDSWREKLISLHE